MEPIQLPDEELLSTTQAAKLLNVKPSWLYKAGKEKGLPAVRVGKHLRYSKQGLIVWALNQQAWEWNLEPEESPEVPDTAEEGTDAKPD